MFNCYFICDCYPHLYWNWPAYKFSAALQASGDEKKKQREGHKGTHRPNTLEKKSHIENQMNVKVNVKTK